MMSNDISDIEARAQRFFPGGPGKPDRDRIQRELTLDFAALLMQRGDKTPDEVTEQFGVQYSGILAWLGDTRQDTMLIDAMAMTGIDLMHWLEERQQ